MTHIVHWHDVIGEDWLKDFTAISRTLFYAEQRGAYASALAKLGDENRAKYELKRDLMRKCGYEVNDNGDFVCWHGWYGWPEIIGEAVKFKTTAPPDREYITLHKFLDFKRGLSQTAIEDEYYGEQDPNFPREE